MLDVLNEALHALPQLVFEDPSTWQTLAVRYETPHVDRVWRQWGDYRLYLHCIYPCDKPLYHLHPWASGIAVISGFQRMGVGLAGPDGVPITVATTVLGAGSRYEMVYPEAMHFVQPLGGPSMSVMVTARPWSSEVARGHQPGHGLVHDPLPDPTRDAILNFYRQIPTANYLTPW